MKQPKIVAYLKPQCGWSMGVREIMKKYSLKYEDRNIIDNQKQFQEMVEKSGQTLSPCVEVNGEMLIDVSGDEVEQYLAEKSFVKKKFDKTEVPTDSACVGH
ncbi:glutaredoxin [Candidatus Woesearchaeota archaeon]|nr:glutaredoxin [Candidatus Woesearchaeota archaeon]